MLAALMVALVASTCWLSPGRCSLSPVCPAKILAFCTRSFFPVTVPVINAMATETMGRLTSAMATR
jgi:hypothetical protein